MTVKEMLRRIDSAEITRWAGYEQEFGPLGGLRSDIQTAFLAATIMNGFRGMAGKRGSRKLDGFMLKWGKGKERRELTAEDMLEKVRSINKALGGKEVDRRERS